MIHIIVIPITEFIHFFLLLLVGWVGCYFSFFFLCVCTHTVQCSMCIHRILILYSMRRLLRWLETPNMYNKKSSEWKRKIIIIIISQPKPKIKKRIKIHLSNSQCFPDHHGKKHHPDTYHRHLSIHIFFHVSTHFILFQSFSTQTLFGYFALDFFSVRAIFSLYIQNKEKVLGNESA